MSSNLAQPKSAMTSSEQAQPFDFSDFKREYKSGQRRSKVFHRMLMEDAKGAILDIGCGNGFSGHIEPQEMLANRSTRFVGVEPDKEIAVGEYFDDVHRCFFEEADIEANSINTAYAYFVLEHVADSTAFWDKLHHVLAPGGIFWGFTVDKRHYFSMMSRFLDLIRIKDLYLTLIQGKRGEDRYEDYPVYYRANSPRRIRRDTRTFSSVETCSFHRVGQLAYYFPKGMKWLSKLIDRATIGMRMPGSILCVRVTK